MRELVGRASSFTSPTVCDPAPPPLLAVRLVVVPVTGPGLVDSQAAAYVGPPLHLRTPVVVIGAVLEAQNASKREDHLPLRKTRASFDTLSSTISLFGHASHTMADTAGYPTDTSKTGLGHEGIHTNKRKREARDQGTSRPAPSANNTNSSDLSEQAFASLAAHNASANGEDMQQQYDGANNQSMGETAAAAIAHYQMTVPQATELSFQPQSSTGDSSFNLGDHHQSQGMQDFSLEALKAATSTARTTQATGNESPPASTSHKPTVGSEEWHKVRRDNHKEGE